MATRERQLADGVARRLRTDPLETVEQIAGGIGPRPAASVAEAKAAAYLDARLRRAGMQVWLESFSIPAGPGMDGWLLGALALISALLYGWFAVPSLFLALWGLLMVLLIARRGGEPLVVRRLTTQHVVATQSIRVRPVARVVLLTPLDSPAVVPEGLRRIGSGTGLLIVRGMLLLLLVLAGLVGLLAPAIFWWALQCVPVLGLLVLAGLESWIARQPGSPGAVNHAGALGALLTGVEDLFGLERVELWVIGVGAARTSAGLLQLLKRYPFEPELTLFIGLESIGRGALSYLAEEGWPRGQRVESQALELVRIAAAEQHIPATPRTFQGETLVAPLRAAGYRALTIACLGADNRLPLFGAANDLPAAVEGRILEQAAQLVVAIVRELEGGGDLKH